jgi:hypothetical protein
MINWFGVNESYNEAVARVLAKMRAEPRARANLNLLDVITLAKWLDSEWCCHCFTVRPHPVSDGKVVCDCGCTECVVMRAFPEKVVV